MKFVLKVIAAVMLALVLTGIFAELLFGFGLAKLRLLKGGDRIDWATVFLGLYLFGYFFGAAQLWYHFIAGHYPPEESKGSQFLKAVFAPIAMPIGFLHFLLEGALAAIFFSFLHEQSKAIALRSYNVFILIWVSIFGVLLFSNLWQPADNQCRWIFPKITTCLLTKYEDLAGGLIGAGGTIFAAWIAWIAVQEQIKRSESS